VLITAALTLAEEARNTERHEWKDINKKLRHAKVNFVRFKRYFTYAEYFQGSVTTRLTVRQVSAGAVDPLEATVPSLKEVEVAMQQPEAESSFAQMSLDPAPEEEMEIEVEVVVDTIEVQIEEDLLDQNPTTLPTMPGKPITAFVIDTQGGQPIRTGIPPPRIREVSPTPSNSSEEIILFTGRNKQNTARVVETRSNLKPTMTITDPIDAKIKAVDDRINKNKGLLEVLQLRDNAAKLPYSPASHSCGEFEALLSKPQRYVRSLLPHFTCFLCSGTNEDFAVAITICPNVVAKDIGEVLSKMKKMHSLLIIWQTWIRMMIYLEILHSIKEN
jgi:hypothetical protein